MIRQQVRRAVVALVAVALFGPSASAEAPDAHLKRGINILGYDGLWNGEVDNPFRMSDFARIRRAGFDHVRVNFFGLRYMNAHRVLDDAVLKRLDRVLDEAAKNGLWVVLDQHDNQSCNNEPASCKALLTAFWRQIAARYGGARPTVVYEILNEPGWRMDAETWNDVLAASIAEIRAKDPQRAVVAAVLNTDDPDNPKKLRLPANDARLIVTVHYYGPMKFTHQGAPWSDEYENLKNVPWGAPASREQVKAELAPMAAWSTLHDRPIYLGEFGALESAPPKARADWTQFVARTVESFGWGWAYWQFDHDFSATDPETRAWNQPLLDALMAPAQGPAR